MTLPDLSALESATFEADPRRGYTGPIPEKVAQMVKELADNGGKYTIPGDETYREAMAPVFAAAAKAIGMQSRIWAEKSGKGFNVSVSDKPIGRKPGTNGDTPEDESSESSE